MQNGTKRILKVLAACGLALGVAHVASAGGEDIGARHGQPSLSDGYSISLVVQPLYDGKTEYDYLVPGQPYDPSDLYSHVDIPEIAGKSDRAGGQDGEDGNREDDEDPSGESAWLDGGKIDLFGPGAAVFDVFDVFDGTPSVTDGLPGYGVIGDLKVSSGGGFVVSAPSGVPTPGGIGVLSLGLLAAARRRRR